MGLMRKLFIPNTYAQTHHRPSRGHGGYIGLPSVAFYAPAVLLASFLMHMHWGSSTRYKLVSVGRVCVCYYMRLYMPLLRLYHAQGPQREPLMRHGGLYSKSMQPVGHRYEHR